MSRTLDTATLDLAARQWAAQFLQPTVWSKNDSKVAIQGRDWVLQSFFNATFKDEFTYLLSKFKAQLGTDSLKDFEEEAAKLFTPRDDAVLATMLAEKLAITPEGGHIPGKIGTVNTGSRLVGKRVNSRGTVKDALWPVYAGEEHERGANSSAVDPLPDPKTMFVNDGHLALVKEG